MAIPAWLLGIIPSIVNSAREWVSRKQKISELKTEAALVLEQKKIESAIRRVESADLADTVLDKESLENTGWKDEYLLLITTLPMVLLFVSPFLDIVFGGCVTQTLVENQGPGMAATPAITETSCSLMYTDGMIAGAVNEGFDSLSKAPEPYWWAMGAVYIHALGMRRMVRLAMDQLTSKLFKFGGTSK